MSLEVKKGFFADRSEIMDDLKKTGFWPTTFISEPYPGVGVHWHDVDINGYVISGSTWVRDGKTGEKITIEAGDKLLIPRGALHAEGEVTDTVTYIVATSRPGQLLDLLQMKSPSEPADPDAS